MKHVFLKHWFILLLFVAVLAGVFTPQAALLNTGNWLTDSAIVVIFLGMGFTLPSEAIISGLSKWKIHIFLQFFIFLLTPLIFIMTCSLLKPYLAHEIYIGLLALSVLPTTISTCAVFTQTSGGDAVLTLFNAALANILGIAISPLLLSLLLSKAGQNMPPEVLFGIIAGLATKMIIPLFIGQLLHFACKKYASAWKKPIGTISNILILIIVFFTLSQSTSAPFFQRGFSALVIPLLYLIAIHFLLLGSAWILSVAFRFSNAEKISPLYTAPQKTMAMGVPLMTAYFASQPELLGAAILPLLFYHPWQLLIAGILKSMPFMQRWHNS